MNITLMRIPLSWIREDLATNINAYYYHNNKLLLNNRLCLFMNTIIISYNDQTDLDELQ